MFTMNKAIVGTKMGMTQIFKDNGTVVPVTVVKAGPVSVTQVKTMSNDGYSAIQVAFEDIRESLANKCKQGHFKKAGVSVKRFLNEFRIDNAESFELGQEIKCDTFAEGDIIDVTGTTRGRGFTGTIQRWNMSCGPMTHGSHYHRGVGSLGACSSPSRVFKNKRMPGHYGVEQVTIQNLEVVKVDVNRDLLFIKGAIPGPKKGFVVIKNALKRSK